ncbi:MAG: DUF4494 domain-containing protein [Bacteroidota bacterium]
MKIWYACKVRFTKETEDGTLKQVTETFLIDAVSYTEAETRIYAAMEQNIAGEFTINSISKTNLSEVINYEDVDTWYKCKVSYSTVDADSEKEIKINTYYLVSAQNVKEAYERVEDNLSSMLVPFDIPSITVTKIMEVFPYEKGDDEIPENFKPLSEVEQAEEETAEEEVAETEE